MNAKDHTGHTQMNMIMARSGECDSNLTVDPDDFIRRQELMEEQCRRPVHSSLPFRAAENFASGLKVRERKIDVAGKPIITPCARLRSITPVRSPFPFISLADFIAAARASSKQIRDWVEAGGTAGARHDRRGIRLLITPPSVHAVQHGGSGDSRQYLQTFLNSDYLLPIPGGAGSPRWGWLRGDRAVSSAAPAG
jgi:hypothetical protein